MMKFSVFRPKGFRPWWLRVTMRWWECYSLESSNHLDVTWTDAIQCLIHAHSPSTAGLEPLVTSSWLYPAIEGKCHWGHEQDCDHQGIETAIAGSFSPSHRGSGGVPHLFFRTDRAQDHQLWTHLLRTLVDNHLPFFFWISVLICSSLVSKKLSLEIHSVPW